MKLVKYVEDVIHAYDGDVDKMDGNPIKRFKYI